MLFNLLFKKRNVNSSGAVLLAMLCATILSCARNNGTATEIGTPIGDPVVATIDASGGTLASTDGLFEVIVPAGAVSSATDFEIQEITNNCFGGLGNGFAIKPADMVFNDNVTLVFHYGNVIDEFIDFSTLRMAIQDDRQIWMAFKDQQVDSVAKTISIKTTSFSPFAKTSNSQIKTAANTPGQSVSLLSSMRIIPQEGYVKLNKSQTLRLEVNCPNCYSDADSSESMTPLVNWTKSTFKNTEWDIVEGPGDLLSYSFASNPAVCDYIAPESLDPGDDGKVRIQATTTVKSGKKNLTGVAFAKINVEANQYRFKMIIEWDSSIPGTCAIEQGYKDQAYFTFTIYNNTLSPGAIENFVATAGAVTSLYGPSCSVNVTDPGNRIQLDSMNGTINKVFINGKPMTQIALTGKGTSREPDYFYDCGDGNTFYCPPSSPENYAQYGMSFRVEDKSTYKASGDYGTFGVKYEILTLEGP